MTTFNIKNSIGSTVATITPATTTSTSFPITLIGESIFPYGEYIATTQYHLMENFAANVPPVNPVTGMTWYDMTNKVIKVYDGVNFVAINTINTDKSSMFTMDSTATNIPLDIKATTVLFTSPDNGSRFLPTSVLMIVNGTPVATDTALFELHVNNAEDVLQTSVVSLNDTQFVMFDMQGTSAFVSGTDSIKLTVTSPVTTGSLAVDVYIFGLAI